MEELCAGRNPELYRLERADHGRVMYGIALRLQRRAPNTVQNEDQGMCKTIPWVLCLSTLWIGAFDLIATLTPAQRSAVAAWPSANVGMTV
jgi:hypothetical protein